MRKNYTFNLTFVIVFMFTISQAQTTLVFEDFEDSTVGYTLLDESNGGTPFNEDVTQTLEEDYFGRVAIVDLDPADALGYANFQGIRFFGANDYDSIDSYPFSRDIVSINWNNINISGFTDINVSALFAEGDATDNNEDWDTTGNFTRVRLEYSFDGVVWTSIFSIVGDPAGASSTNTRPVLDSDNNGTPNMPIVEVDETFDVLAGTFLTMDNTSVNIRVFMENLTGTDEDIAFDNFIVTGVDNTLSNDNFSSKEFELVVYPNPTTDILNIKTSLEINNIQIYNLQGQKVSVFNGNKIINNAINLSELSNGFYLIEIHSSKKKETFKILKQ